LHLKNGRFEKGPGGNPGKKTARLLKSTAMPFRDIDFLIVEIRSGFTWSRIAEVSRDEARRKRSRAQARRAYDRALAFLGKATLKQNEASRVLFNLASLRSELLRLGEDV